MYQVFFVLNLQAVVSSRGIILKCFSNEAHDMYRALYDCARSYGTCSERAVIKALLGHSKTSAAVLAKGKAKLSHYQKFGAPYQREQ